MNCDNGHLVTSDFMEELRKSGAISTSQELFAKGALNAFKGSPYTPVPDELDHAATCALDGKEETHISMTSGGKLSKWAAKERKTKRKQQRESRKQNR